MPGEATFLGDERMSASSLKIIPQPRAQDGLVSVMLLSGLTPFGLSVFLTLQRGGGHCPGPASPKDPEGPFFSKAFGF